MRTFIVGFLILVVAGCGGQSTPSGVAVAVPVEAAATVTVAASKASTDLAFGHWQLETARIKEYETHASSVGTNWMSVMAARTSRMHSIPNLKDSSIVLGVSLKTDAAFLQETEPSDMSVIEAGAFWKSYGAALQIAEQAFRDRGDAASAEKILAHRNEVFR